MPPDPYPYLVGLGRTKIFRDHCFIGDVVYACMMCLATISMGLPSLWYYCVFSADCRNKSLRDTAPHRYVLPRDVIHLRRVYNLEKVNQFTLTLRVLQIRDQKWLLDNRDTVRSVTHKYRELLQFTLLTSQYGGASILSVKARCHYLM